MSKISQKQQMNVPHRTRSNQQVQTDVNLLGHGVHNQISEQTINHQSQVFQFVNQSWMLPFSDYYLLNQLNSVIKQLKTNTAINDQYKTRRVIDELASKMHGLLARQFKLTSSHNGYYNILLDKEKEMTKLQIKYGNYQKKIDSYALRIQELQRQIQNLRGSLKIYQVAAQQNEQYKQLYKELKYITVNTKRQADFEKILNQKILIRMKQFQANLSQVSKNAAKERNSKQKAAISKYALQLDTLAKSKAVDWQTLSKSAAAFYIGLESLNGDQWFKQRLNLPESYNELRNRHISIISIVQKNISQLLKKGDQFKDLNQVRTLLQTLREQNQQGYQTVIVNGWIGLGITHYHHNHEGDSDTNNNYKALILLFQKQMTKLIDKYPQLKQSLSVQLHKFLSIEISRQIIGSDALAWLKQILVKQVQVVHVDNVYNYFSKSDKTNIFYLRVLGKALLDQLKRIANQHKINIELDQAILQLLKGQILDGVNIDDIIALFRPSAKICQVNVLVDKPTYLPATQTIGVPLRQQKAVIVSESSHFAVNIQQGVPYRKQIPYSYTITDVVPIHAKIDKPYAVPTKVTQQIIRQVEIVIPVEVPVQHDRYIQLVRQIAIQTPQQQILATQQIPKQIKIPYFTNQKQQVIIQVQKQIPKNIYKQINKIFKIQQTIPKVYKQPKFEIIQKPTHHVVVQKQIQFVEVEKPIIQRVQVTKIVQSIVQKPIYYKQHCDCQKPQAVIMQVQKPVYKQIVKQIIIEKCHFVQPNIQQKIVEIPCYSQIPVYKQIIKQQPVFIDKIIPFRTVQQKLVVVDRQIPFFIQHFTPVELIVQKPVIVRDIKHIPVAVEQPIPIYIQKIVPKIVNVYRDKIVQKIVQIPRVQIVQKIVQKIVVVPRIVQKIVTVIQKVDVPIFIETPILQIIQIPVQKLVTNTQQIEKVIQVKKQVLKIQKDLQIVQKIQYQEVRTVIQVQPQVYPQIIVQKIVTTIQQKPVQLHVDRIVDRVVFIKEIIPVQQRVQIPMQVECPIQIINNKPVFYKQPIVQIDVHRVQRQKIVQLINQVIKIKQIPVPYLKKQKQFIEIPGQTIILKQPELHIIQVQKQTVITATDVKQTPVQQYLDIHKAFVIDQQTHIIPQKEILYLQKPYPVSIQRPVILKNQQKVLIQRPNTLLIKTRQGRSQQVIKTITNQKLAIATESYPEPIRVPEHHYQILYEELPPKVYDRSVLAINQKVRTQEITNVIQIMGALKQITKQYEVPVFVQRIFQKILMLPQIVEVEKKVYMIEQINSLIAKEVNLETHYEDYQAHMLGVKNAINDILITLNSGKLGNTSQIKKKLTLLLQLLKTQSRIPKIVETIKEVQVIKERDRPVLVPVYDSQREKVLHAIISDLIEGIKGFSKAELQKRFSQRIIKLFSTQFGISIPNEQQFSEFIIGHQKTVIESKSKSWLNNYGKNLPSTRPIQQLTPEESQYIVGLNSKQFDFNALKATLQKSIFANKQRLHEIGNLKKEYSETINSLNVRIKQLEENLAQSKFYKDYYFNQLLKIGRILEQKQYDQILLLLQNINRIEYDQSSRSITIAKDHKDQKPSISEQAQQNTSKIINQLKIYESQINTINKYNQELKKQNDRLKCQIDEIQLNIPVWNRQTDNQSLKRYNQEWEQRIRGLEQNHFLQLNHLRQQLVKRLTGAGSTNAGDQFARNYEQLLKKYSALTQAQSNAENSKRNIVNNYEDRLKDANKQLICLKRQIENLQKKKQADRNRLIDEYERRISSTSSNQEKQLRRQNDLLKRNYENLQQRAQAEKNRLLDEYERKLSTTANNQQKLLKKQLETIKKNAQMTQQKLQAEKKKIIDDYEKKLTTGATNQQKQLKKQIENLKRSYQNLQSKAEGEKNKADYEKQKAEDEKKKLIEDYQAKLRSSGSSQDKQLKKQLDNLKKNFENYQRNADTQKNKTTDEYQKRIKQLQDDIQRMKASKRGNVTSPQKNQQLQLLKDKIKKLQIELDSSKRQIQNYQKSRLGQTTYTSGLKHSNIQGEFQSPQGASRYKSSGPKFEDVIESSGFSKQQESPQRGTMSKSGIGSQKIKLEQAQQRSSSSRVSGGSQSSNFKTSMTMRQFMQYKKADDKDSILTFVMIKVIQKIQQESKKGIINSYSPSNIYLSNFNQNNLDNLIVRFGAPITNRKSKTDGLYLAPQVLRGEGTTLKSVVYTLGTVWDELIHYEIYYKSIAQIENLSYQYKVRNTSLNPILRNTLFEMMSKDPSKRLDLAQAKRRLSLQRYITSQGKK